MDSVYRGFSYKKLVLFDPCYLVSWVGSLWPVVLHLVSQKSRYTLLNDGAYNDSDVPEVVHHIDCEDPNSRDDEDDKELEVTKTT